jgi:hypothetical protein
VVEDVFEIDGITLFIGWPVDFSSGKALSLFVDPVSIGKAIFKHQS